MIPVAMLTNLQFQVSFMRSLPIYLVARAVRSSHERIGRRSPQTIRVGNSPFGVVAVRLG